MEVSSAGETSSSSKVLAVLLAEPDLDRSQGRLRRNKADNNRQNTGEDCGGDEAAHGTKGSLRHHCGKDEVDEAGKYAGDGAVLIGALPVQAQQQGEEQCRSQTADRKVHHQLHGIGGIDGDEKDNDTDNNQNDRRDFFHLLLAGLRLENILIEVFTNGSADQQHHGGNGRLDRCGNGGEDHTHQRCRKRQECQIRGRMVRYCQLGIDNADNTAHQKQSNVDEQGGNATNYRCALQRRGILIGQVSLCHMGKGNAGETKHDQERAQARCAHYAGGRYHILRGLGSTQHGREVGEGTVVVAHIAGVAEGDGQNSGDHNEALEDGGSRHALHAAQKRIQAYNCAKEEQAYPVRAAGHHFKHTGAADDLTGGIAQQEHDHGNGEDDGKCFTVIVSVLHQTDEGHCADTPTDDSNLLAGTAQREHHGEVGHHTDDGIGKAGLENHAVRADEGTRAEKGSHHHHTQSQAAKTAPAGKEAALIVACCGLFLCAIGEEADQRDDHDVGNEQSENYDARRVGNINIHASLTSSSL